MYVVYDDGLSVTWGFCEPDISRNDRVEYLGTEKAAEVGGDLLGKRCAVIKHGEENAFYGKRRVNGATQAHESVVEFGDAFHGVVFALNRNQDGVTGRKSIDGEQVQSRRAIDEDEVVAIANALCECFQSILAIFHADELYGSADEVLVRWQQIEAGDLRLDDDTFWRIIKYDGIIDGSARRVLWESQASGRISLRIAVDYEGTLALCREGGT
jgi:hypothetical protein